jgi:hypothetical protein
VQKSIAEKEREAWYSNYVDNTDKNWSEHLWAVHRRRPSASAFLRGS